MRGRWWMWVSLPYATFTLDVGEDRRIVDAAPVARWALGRDAAWVKAYYRDRGATVVVLDS